MRGRNAGLDRTNRASDQTRTGDPFITNELDSPLFPNDLGHMGRWCDFGVIPGAEYRLCVRKDHPVFVARWESQCARYQYMRAHERRASDALPYYLMLLFLLTFSGLVLELVYALWG